MELEPCPFCGATDVFVERADFTGCYVICNNCGACGPTCCDENEADSDASESGEAEPGELPARRKWNSRVLPQREGVIDLTFERQVLAELEEAATHFAISSNVRSHIDRAIIAISSLIRSLKGSTGGE